MYVQIASHPKLYRPHVQFWSMRTLALMAPALSQQLVKYRTNTPDNNSFEGLHSVFACSIQGASAGETPLNTNRIKYNFRLCLFFEFVQVWKKNHYLQSLPSRLCKSNLLVQYKCFLFHSDWPRQCSLMQNVSCMTIALQTACAQNWLLCLWKINTREGKPNSCAHAESSPCSSTGSQLAISHLPKCFHLERGGMKPPVSALKGWPKKGSMVLEWFAG